MVQAALEKHESVLKVDTGAKSVEYKKTDKFDAEESTMIDGQPIWVGIRKL
jgi:hypothetical protein